MAALNGAAAGAARLSTQAAPSRDPFAGVLTMGPRIPVAATIAFALMLHAGAAAGATAAVMFSEIFAWNRGVQAAVLAKLDQTYDIEVVKPQELPPEPPPPEPTPEETKPEPKPVDDTPPPPSPAQAGKILAAEPDPNAVVDMRDTFTQGDAVDFTGGLTSSVGKSTTPVYNVAAANTGVPGGTGTKPAPPPPPKKEDLSRGARISGSTDWGDCPFPPEADADQIDDAYVTVQVRVNPDGSAQSVKVVQDPGHGFGRAARSCALRKHYQNALDVDGHAIGGMTSPFRVHFQR
jgi:protein TonB